MDKPTRDKNGRFLTVPAGAAPPITSANARDMVRKRQEKYRRVANSRIVEEARSIDPTVQTPADAFGILAAKQYTTILDSDKPAMNDVEKLHKLMTGTNEVDAQRENTQPGVISASASAMRELLDMIEARQSAAVDRARAIEGKSRDA